MKSLIIAICFFAVGAQAQNPITLKACEVFKEQLAKDNVVTASTLEVPLHYGLTKGSKKINIFYWIKKGTDSSKVPVLLIHGGPGANSWRYYSTFKDSTYTGDIIAIDNRNEGCSHVKSYDDLPENYQAFRARNIVRDLETLRKHLYGGYSKWRIFGQSRGGPIAHYYLEMYPDSLESVQAHGFAMMTKKNMEQYTFMRSHFSARASERFAQQFPQAKDVLVEAQDYFEKNKTCLPMDLNMTGMAQEKQPRVCGRIITDGISYRLSNYARWSAISADLLSLRNSDGTLDVQKAIAMFQKEVNGNIYVQYMNYILGTNAQDVGSPAPRNFDAINADPYLKKALISEGRFVANAVYPAYLSLGYPALNGDVDPIDFVKVKEILKNYEKRTGAKFKLILFSSHFDTVAGPEMYSDEQRLLGPYVEVRSLANSGHEGWGTESEIKETIFR